MSENKFIKHLRGKGTAKSVLEVKNQNTPTSFANMPDGSSNANDTYSDYRGNATSVLKGTENWKLDTATLVESATVYGDGRDMTGSYDANGSTLWVDATATFSASRRYSPNTKFVLKLCGNNLLSATEETIDFTLLVNIGTTTVTKTFTIAEQANFFCKEFVIDFSESNGNTIKIAQNDTINVQLLCGDPNASATIYNGMTVFTALQRRVDADAVSSDTRTLDELEEDFEEFMSDTETALNGKVSKTGDTMSGALDIANIASSNAPLLTLTHSSTATYKWNIAPRYNSTTLSIYPGSTETNGFRFATTGFVPASNNARYLGSASLKWKGIYVGVINNGADLTVPNKTGTLATMGDVELAARSGRMLTDQGVWYAKMYAATVVPTGAEYDGKNYADFSQVDADNNPIIKIYTGASGAWTLSETITPPAEYDGYVPITSKIWDIAEQSGQQGGRVLWNHQSKEFTPYPQIISFENIGITGNSTVVMPQNPGANQIVNKDYVDEAIAAIPTPTSFENIGITGNSTVVMPQNPGANQIVNKNYVDEAIASIPTPTVDVTQSIDAEIVGTLTITDNSIVSGFSANNYLKLPGVFELGSGDTSSFEIGAAFIGGNISHGEANVLLSGQQINSTLFAGLSISFGSSSDRKLRVQIRGSGATQTIVGTTDLGTEKVYIN